MAAVPLSELRKKIRENSLADEAEALSSLIKTAALSSEERAAISKDAESLVRAVRGVSDPQLMESFLAEYGLSTKEGVALMCLAEALLRVPDAETVDELIRDKIAPHDWSEHIGDSGSIFVNASTWALMLTGRVLEDGDGGIEGTLRGLVRRLGEPVIRRAVGVAMRELGEQFVLGRAIDEAQRNGASWRAKGYLYSYDMLGEAARTEADAQRYFKAYADAISALDGKAAGNDIRKNPGISVKLSALHPRYELAQKELMLPVMTERLSALCRAARDARMGLNIDAEESDRLDLSLDVIEQVLAQDEFRGWDGFGVVVQAYGPRAAHTLDWLYALAEKLDRRIMVRLVKGAYWDSEIKRAQVMGLPGYPVFTRKTNTDVSYIACARKLLGMTDRIYPQFATHNAHTVAAVLKMAGENRDSFEFQRLHGMGEALHEAVRKRECTTCRIYAPVGAHEDLLAYLVRRLLENGANSSFVHQIVDDEVKPEQIAADPFAAAEKQGQAHNPAIPMPDGIFRPERPNSRGYDIAFAETLTELEALRQPFAAPHQWSAAPLTKASGATGKPRPIVNPANPEETVGSVVEASKAAVGKAIDTALKAQPAWASLPVAERAALLTRIAQLYEENTGEFLALATREAGKTMADAIAELREAVDFLHYYAAGAAKTEKDSAARGVIVCISPWNFPLAIFTGQIAAALVTGNAVVAKPAEQTPLIAHRAVELMLEAGIPDDIIQLMPGDGPSVGQPLTADPRIAGVCFTGSVEVARLIERQLAETAAPDAMLIAETGGLNAMIVDSTALPEQAVRDIVASAFQSAGQRCSALRMLYVQRDVSEKLLTMLTGAMQALQVGDPWRISTDVGPVIDDEANASIGAYCEKMTADGRLIEKLESPGNGRFLPPHLFRVSGIEDLEREIFGPVLHVATFEGDEIDKVIDAVNARGYGLTFGLHTRIDARVQYVMDRMRVGNFYVNRNQIGAVVGAQPFGGEGLSGTGPKAGGPHYLAHFRKPLGRRPESTGDLGGEPVAAIDTANLPKAHDDGWATRTDRIAVLRKVLRGRAASAIAAAAALDFGPVDLPGPTGEANSLALHPRGRVLCLGLDGETLLAQAVQALAAGNAVVAIAPGAISALNVLLGKGMPIAAFDGVPGEEHLTGLDINLVALVAHDDQLGETRRALAERNGPIIRLVTDPIDSEAYVLERATCVDTTAAGGNASLLAAAE